MSRDTLFHDYVMHDLLGNVSGITSRAMFGGWAIYQNGIIFGIIVGGELYFKINEANRSDLEAAEGSHPFVYTRKDGKQITMSYRFIPEEIMEDREQLHDLMGKSTTIKKEIVVVDTL